MKEEDRLGDIRKEYEYLISENPPKYKNPINKQSIKKLQSFLANFSLNIRRLY